MNIRPLHSYRVICINTSRLEANHNPHHTIVHINAPDEYEAMKNAAIAIGGEPLCAERIQQGDHA